MVATADYILKWHEDEMILAQVASWNKGQIQVDTNLCKRYGNWLMNNYLSDMDWSSNEASDMDWSSNYTSDLEDCIHGIQML